MKLTHFKVSDCVYCLLFTDSIFFGKEKICNTIGREIQNKQQQHHQCTNEKELTDSVDDNDELHNEKN